MATLVGTQKQLSKLLKGLVELDYDAIAAYREAINRFNDRAYASQFEAFAADHDRHVRELSVLIEELGEQPPTGPDMKGVLTKGKVVIAALIGDRAILMAMKTNEDDTNTAYERAAGRSDLPQNILNVLQRNLTDERRHRSWIEQQLNVDTNVRA